MHRAEQKCWFHRSRLVPLLEQILPFYYILEVERKRLIAYQTLYFDTPDNQMYLHHHNGYRWRYKIRRRKYETAQNGFFEIKSKNNKQQTLKKRVEAPFTKEGVSTEERTFLGQHTPYGNEPLTPVLYNQFRRFTLINDEINERCTFDIQLQLHNGQQKTRIDELVILEVKRENRYWPSVITTALKDLQIRQRGLSKYCMGRAILETDLKNNAFKARLNYLQNKIINFPAYV